MSHFNVAVFTRNPEDVDALLAPYNECVDADSPYAEFQERKEAPLDPSMGKHGYWYNPQARWDYYCIGGRWSGQLQLKEGRQGLYGREYDEEERNHLKPGRCDCALAADVDAARNEEAYKRAIRFWEITVEGKNASAEEQEAFFSLYNPNYFLRQYGTKENYAACQSEFSVYAFVAPDGS